MTKQYDRAYFDRWYRKRNTRVLSHAEVRVKVALAIASAEYFLRRPIHNVLDVGCGEGAWLPHLRALRPKVEYLGLDPSAYVVHRFGATRNIRQASFADLPALKLGVYDMVVCCDVMHYVPEPELHTGLTTIAAAMDGVAYLEVLTKEDDIEGDLDGFIRRPAAFYRTLFRKAGMTSIGPYLWLAPPFKDAVAELESAR